MRISPTVTIGALAACVGVVRVAAQQAAEPSFVIDGDAGLIVPDIRSAVLYRGGSVVLSAPGPALHRVAGSRVRHEWGRAGEGPGELRDPVDLDWSGDAGIVLDQVQRRLTGFDEAGRVLFTRSLGTDWANRVRLVGRDTVVQVFVPMADARVIVRLRGLRRDTIATLRHTAVDVHLDPPSGPSLTVSSPFASVAQWTDVPGRGVAVWQPGAPNIVVLDLTGREVERLPVPGGSFRVLPADREWWFANAIPGDFRGGRIFEAVRRLARDKVRFPESHAPVTGLEADATGAIWVRRTGTGAGEVWQRIGTNGGIVATLRLPRGRRLLDLGDGIAIASSTSDMDEPVVEGYQLPRGQAGRPPGTR
jgi:hypothetical protein